MTQYQYTAIDFPNSTLADTGDLHYKISQLGLTTGNITNISTSGSGSEMVIIIYFDNTLSTVDLNTLNTFINTYTDASTETICSVKETQSSGTNGGTFTKGIWTTRNLNTITPPVSFLSISNNQITIQPGSYIMIVRAPAYGVNGNQIRFRNITNITTPTYTYGMNSFVSGNNQKNAELYGNFNFDTVSVFDIQHICEVTKSNIGLGIATANGEVEIYTSVFIQKLS
jgi:hypothetical protein